MNFPALLLRVALAATVLFNCPAFANDADPAQPMVKVLQPFVDDRVLAGAVTLVANKDKVLDLEAVGYSDVAAKKPMRTDSLFWVASISKSLTATTVMMLVDEGKISLDDPIEKYIPEFKDVMVVDKTDKKAPPHKPAKPITIAMLLSHTAGMSFGFEQQEKQKFDVGTLAERVRHYAQMPLVNEPGTTYQYSNAGISTAGRIVEIVSGMPFEKFLAERLLKPLGMKDTTFVPNKEQLTRLAKAYQGTPDKSDLEETPIDLLTYPLDDPKRQPFPAGGLFSTAPDLARFARMILNNGTLDGKTYLKPETVKLMSDKHTPGDDKVGYGYGFKISSPGVFGHLGKYGSHYTIDPAHNFITIFMIQNAEWRDREKGNKISPAFGNEAHRLYLKK